MEDIIKMKKDLNENIVLVTKFLNINNDDIKP